MLFTNECTERYRKFSLTGYSGKSDTRILHEDPILEKEFIYAANWCNLKELYHRNY